VEADIAAFRDSLLKKKYTPKSVSRKLNAVKTFFRYLVSQKKLMSNPSEDVSHPKIEASVPKFLSPLEYRALRDVVKDDIRVSTVVEVILQTGMRISEISNLKVNDIKEKEIQIQPHATQPARTIPLNTPAKEALKEYLKERPETDSEYVFISKNGKPLAVRNIRASIDRYMQKAEISQYSVNDLRTTFLVQNLKNGVDIVLLSKTVGHKRLSTTERYLELAEMKDPGNRQDLIEL
jgi:site-specific recombinase XerD